MNNKIYKYLFFISFITAFFPLFVIYIVKGTHGNIPICLILMLILDILLFLFNAKKMLKRCKNLLNLRIIKIYLIFLSFIMFTTFFNIISGHYLEKISFYAVRIYPLLMAMCLVYFLPVIGIFLNVKFKTIIKVFYSIIFFIFICDIIQYLSFIFNLNFISDFFEIFMNAREGFYGENIMSARTWYRVYAFFSEPSGLGQFIFIIMPFIFSLSYSKYKLYNNKYLNFTVKKTILPIMLAVIILTKSPIYLVLCLSEFFILSIIYNIKFIKKYFIQILCIILLTFFSLLLLYFKYSTALEQTYIIRIIKTIQSFGSFDNLVYLEPSLATRIYNYNIQFVAFTKNILIGCGLCNSEVCVNSFYLKESVLSPTMENLGKQYLVKPNSTGLNKSLVWTSLAEFGAIGFLIYSCFVYYNLKILKKITNYYTGLYNDFLVGLKYSIYVIIIISFYNVGLDNSFAWLIYGILLSAVFLFKGKMNA